MNLTISIRDHASPLLQKVIDGLQNRGALHLSIGKRAQNCIRDYLIGLAGSRHATATSLGAQPSGHLGKAAEKVGLASALQDTGDGVTISISQPGMRRAFQDMDIRPGPGKKYLTIPARAEAYNKRAYRFNNLELLFGRNGPYALVERQAFSFTIRRGKKLGDRDTKIENVKSVGGGIFYWLVKSVSQPQDRTLLPSDEAIAESAVAGAFDYVRMLVNSRSASLSQI